MKRILHFVHALTQSSGLTNSIMNYYRHLDTSLIQFDFVYFTVAESSIIDEITRMGGRVFRFTEPKHFFKCLKERKAFFKNHKNEYFAIHGNALFAVLFYGQVAKRNGISHVISHAHSTVYGESFLSKLRNYFVIRMTRLIATDFLACSKQAGVFLFGQRVGNSEKVLVIHNAIDCDKYQFSSVERSNVRKELKIQDNEFALCHVGGFKAVKNHGFILDVFYEYLKNNPESKLILVGGESGVEKNITRYLSSKIEKMKIQQKVVMAGVRSDINSILSGMDGFIFPSLYEGLPTALIEAQASGLDCIVSDVVTNEIDIGLCHFISLEEDLSIWRDAISQYCSNKKDRKVYCDIAKESFDIDHEARKLQQFYLTI